MYTPLMIGMWEWIAIGLAIILFFGASKLPKLGQGLGEGIRNFKKGIKGELDAEKKPIAATAESDEEAESTDASNADNAEAKSTSESTSESTS